MEFPVCDVTRAVLRDPPQPHSEAWTRPFFEGCDLPQHGDEDILLDIVGIHCRQAVFPALGSNQRPVQVRQVHPAIRLALLGPLDQAERRSEAERFPHRTIIIVGIFHDFSAQPRRRAIWLSSR
jgi:hypothetical protein